MIATKISEINFNKHKTFFLYYYKENSSNYQQHLIRPSTASYKDIINQKPNTSILIEGAVLSFDQTATISQIIMECTILGISIDFIEVMKSKKISNWSENECIRFIDCHKDDMTDILNEVEAPRFYITLNKNKNKKQELKYLVIDRFSQSKKVKFLQGKYNDKAIIAVFKDRDDAVNYCELKNEKQD